MLVPWCDMENSVHGFVARSWGPLEYAFWLFEVYELQDMVFYFLAPR